MRAGEGERGKEAAGVGFLKTMRHSEAKRETGPVRGPVRSSRGLLGGEDAVGEERSIRPAARGIGDCERFFLFQAK